jgi:alpha-galactosidase/6-phospho-beta-glucosidase family protein
VAGPKFVVVGAGSIFFTRAVAVGMCKDPRFKGGTLSLVDTNPEMLDVMARLCRRIVAETGAELTIEATGDRRTAFRGANFIVLSFSRRGVDLRETDTVIPAKYGVLQSSGDSIGPGGLFRSIRTVPAVLEMARDMEAICPDAWVFNYVNPTTVMGAALARHSRMKSLAICDGVVLPDTTLALLDRVGVPREAAAEVTMKIGGLNHFSWLTEFRRGKRDLMPDLLRSLREKPLEYASKAAEQILEIYGWYSLVSGHFVEFLPYFQGHGLKPAESYVNYVFPTNERRKWMRSFNEEIRRQADGKEPIGKLIRDTHADLAIRLADDVIDNSGAEHFVNVPNRGYISNLPAGAEVEVPARIFADRYEGVSFGDMPPVLRSWLLRIIDVQELTLEAAVTGSRRALRQALMADPLTVSIEDTDHILDELLAAEKDDLPEMWR